jgi:hypothetical protein
VRARLGKLTRRYFIRSNVEHAGERELRQLVGGELVGDVVAEFVLVGVVPFFLVDQGEGAAFARISWAEGAGEKFDTLNQALRDWLRQLHTHPLPKVSL